MISRIIWGLIIFNLSYLRPLLAAAPDSCLDSCRAFVSSSGQATISVVIPYRVEKVRADLANASRQSAMQSFYVEKQERVLHQDSVSNYLSIISADDYEANRFKPAVRIQTEIFYPQ